MINPIIQKYMNDQSIDILLDKKNIFIAKDSYDITQKIINLINKGIKDFISKPIISIKPDIDVIAAIELLNFNLVFKNNNKGLKIIVITRDIDKYIKIGLIK
jgi:hypothetical protein